MNAGMADTLKYAQNFCDKIDEKMNVLCEGYDMEEEF